MYWCFLAHYNIFQVQSYFQGQVRRNKKMYVNIHNVFPTKLNFSVHVALQKWANFFVRSFSLSL